MKSKIKANQVVDGTAATAMPRATHKGDDPECRERRAALISDRQRGLTRTQRNVSGNRNRESVRLKSKNRNVGRGISTSECRVDLATTRQRDLDLVVSLQRFFCGHDDPRTPVDTAGGPSATALNRNHPARGTFNELCNMIRKGNQRVVGLD